MLCESKQKIQPKSEWKKKLRKSEEKQKHFIKSDFKTNVIRVQHTIKVSNWRAKKKKTEKNTKNLQIFVSTEFDNAGHHNGR